MMCLLTKIAPEDAITLQDTQQHAQYHQSLLLHNRSADQGRQAAGVQQFHVMLNCS
jgi:hypothetical protein